MTSATSSLSRSFTGDLELSDAPVAVSVAFADGTVRLVLAGDTIGTWPMADVQFVPVETGYELHAEGDSLPFVPHDGRAFAAFLASRSEAPGPDDSEATSTEAAPTTPAHSEQVEESLPPSQPPLFDLEPTLGANGFEPDFTVFEEEPETALAVRDEPDEYFAAGLNGPSSSPLPSFRSPLANTPPDPPPVGQPEAPEAPEGQAAPEAAPDDPPAERVREFEPPGSEVATPTSDVSAPAQEAVVAEVGAGRREEWTAPPLDQRETAIPYSAAEDHDEAAIAEPPREHPEDQVAVSVDQARTESAPEAAISSHAAEGDDPQPDIDASTSSGELRGRLARLRQRVNDRTSAGQAREDVATEEHEGDTPQPLDDAENLRQWGLVAAGGLVIVAVAVMVIWGLASVLGGDEPVVKATASTVATAVEEPVVTAPPSTAPLAVPATASAEDKAAAAGFVSDWNALAAQYAYSLSIADADSLPISTAPAPTVHLTYADDGILRLNMAPKGSGSDRDILVAMGLAVAWADPGLSPEARKEVLGALGVDVDDPNLTDMGGELNRGGVLYRATVIDGILRFEVDPTG